MYCIDILGFGPGIWSNNDWMFITSVYFNEDGTPIGFRQLPYEEAAAEWEMCGEPYCFDADSSCYTSLNVYHNPDIPDQPVTKNEKERILLTKKLKEFDWGEGPIDSLEVPAISDWIDNGLEAINPPNLSVWRKIQQETPAEFLERVAQEQGISPKDMSDHLDRTYLKVFLSEDGLFHLHEEKK